MTDIEKKALALVNEARSLCRTSILSDKMARDLADELERAIEQHEAFRQKVSEFALGVKGYMASVKAMAWQSDCDEFIIPKTDPLEEALIKGGIVNQSAAEMAADLRAAIEARGGRIVWEGDND